MDYDHRHHVGNRADVWKHVALLALLAAHKDRRVSYLETHAGRGRYPRDRGEWEQGVGRLLALGPTGAGAVDRYVARVRRDETSLAGSPVLAAGSLGRRDHLTLWDAVPEVADALRTALRGDGRAEVRAGDGWSAGWPDRPGDRFALVDPPFSSPEDWLAAGDAVARLHTADPRAVIALWMPIKRWTRPNALRARLRDAGVATLHLDLTWARPEGRTTLAGSGLTLVNAPPTAVAEVLAAGAALGPLLTDDGDWEVHAIGTPGRQSPTNRQ